MDRALLAQGHISVTPHAVQQPPITYSNMDAEIEKQFQSSMHMASTVDSEEFVRV